MKGVSHTFFTKLAPIMAKKQLFSLLLFCIALLSAASLPAATISGFVWDDQNTDGIQDAGEPGLAFVWVSVLDASNNAVVVSSQQTDATGHYNFTGLAAGSYRLKFSNPGGLWQSVMNIGNDALDSDADPLGFTANFTIGANESLDFDAGFTTTPTGCFTPVTITVSTVACDNNGTPADPSDDTYTFVITVSGGTGEWGWDYPAGGLFMQPYDQPVTFGPFPVGGGPITININDHDNPFCTATVTVNPPPPCSTNPQPEVPCDVKIIGCIKYELLSITKDAEQNRTYRIRVTNNCANKLIYAAFQVPDGVVAISPANGSVYTAPSGNQYDVRNPNYSPFYSIRFKSVSDSISNGESDIFEYKLPAQVNPTFIHVIVRVTPKIFYEAHLNTFDCVQGNSLVVNPGTQEADSYNTNFDGNTGSASRSGAFTVFPNPTAGVLYADLSSWAGESLQLALLNAQGQRVRDWTQTADWDADEVILHDLPTGLYFLQVTPPDGNVQVRQFILK